MRIHQIVQFTLHGHHQESNTKDLLALADLRWPLQTTWATDALKSITLIEIERKISRPDRKKEWLANTKARNSNLMTEARCVSKYLQSCLIVKFGCHYQTTTSSYHSNLGLKHHNKAALAIFEMILQLKSTHSFINYCNYCMRGTKTFYRHGSLFWDSVLVSTYN